jgi:hypothetical protein
MSGIARGKNILQGTLPLLSSRTYLKSNRIIPAPEDQDSVARTASMSSIAELALYSKLQLAIREP